MSHQIADDDDCDDCASCDDAAMALVPQNLFYRLYLLYFCTHRMLLECRGFDCYLLLKIDACDGAYDGGSGVIGWNITQLSGKNGPKEIII